MPARLHLPSAGPAAVAPAFDTLWTESATADRVRLSRAKRDTALVDVTVRETSAIALNVLLRQYVSDPLDAQTISGTVRMVARAQQSHAAADFRSQLGLRVVSQDGATVRGTLLAPDTVGALVSEWATGLVNRKFPAAYPDGGQALTPVDAQAGDRLVVEVGYRSHNLSTTGRSGAVNFGDPLAAGDVAENETDKLALCPWLELSHDLMWLYTTGYSWTRGFEVAVPRDEQTGVVDRVTVLSCPVEAGTRRVRCGSDWWDIPPGETGDKLRPVADFPGRTEVT